MGTLERILRPIIIECGYNKHPIRIFLLLRIGCAQYIRVTHHEKQLFAQFNLQHTTSQYE